MQFIAFKTFPLDQDLSQLNRALTESGVPHRITEEQGQQCLWLPADDEGRVSVALSELVDSGLRGELNTPPPREFVRGPRGPSALDVLKRAPVTLVTLILGALGFVAVGWLRSDAVFHALSFLPPEQIVSSGQLYRFITPAFFHFSEMHFLFNALWVYLIGSTIELYWGWRRSALLFVLLAVVSNTLQYIVSGEIYFGGLSGVVYGYMGFIGVAYGVFKVRQLAVASGIFFFAVLSLVLGFAGVLDWMTGARIAHWAHLGGFASGVIAAFLYFSFYRPTRSI